MLKEGGMDNLSFDRSIPPFFPVDQQRSKIMGKN